MSVKEFICKIKKGDINVVENTKKTLLECKKINKEYNYLNVISEDLALESAKQIKKKPLGKLCGVSISVKDCIVVKDVISRAGSKILEGYKPVFDATIIERVKDEGGIIIGKTSQDVFGFGSFNVNVGLGFKVPVNPYDKKRATGGSSGGAAGLTQKLDMPHIAIAESTGGSIVAPASYCGVIGLCPTYGRVSRYGLIDYSNSQDKIGVIGKSIGDVKLLFSVIAGHDTKDSTSINKPVDLKKTKIKKIGVINEAFGKGVSEEVIEKVKEKITQLEKTGIKVEEVSMPLAFKYGVLTYYLISLTEASTNLAKLCGMRYGAQEKLQGNFNEYFTKVRSEYFSKEAKRRIILGTFARMSGFRDAYYMKALKVRTLIIQEYKKLFKKYDLLVSPTMPNIAPRFDEIEKLTPLENFMMDIMTAGPNLAGFPHITLPSGFVDKMPAGIMFTADHLHEKKLFSVGEIINEIAPK